VGKAKAVDETRSVDAARKIAQKALVLMERHRVLPFPQAYTLFFTYCSETRLELNAAVDQYLRSGEKLTEERCAELLANYSWDLEEVNAVSLIARKMETELASAVTLLDSATSSASAYGSSLETARDQVRQAGTKSEIVELVRGLAAQTTEMITQSRNLESQLQQSCREVERLTGELEHLREEASVDSLTQLVNRRLFDARMQQAAVTSTDTGAPLSLLLIDVDHFKKFNDTFGHLIGDQVLRLLGSVLKENCKGLDTPARYGGEEFAVILPDTSLPNAAKFAEKLRKRIADRAIVNRRTGETIGQITVSIGATGYLAGEDIADFIQRCDDALYAAKQQGRNRVISHAAARLTG
jgi:diguanylate cyclase